MGTIKAQVSKVVRNPKNKDGAIVTLNNGQVLWLQISYITKVLEGAFMDDCRPTALIGSNLSYEMKAHAVGDLVFDAKGNVAVGQTTKYTTAGERPINLIIEEVGGFINDFDKAKMQADAVAKLYKTVGAAFGAKPKAQIEQPVDAGTSATVVEEPVLEASPQNEGAAA